LSIDKTSARDVLTKRIALEDSGPLAAEAILSRLADSRNRVLQQSNRFLLASLFLSILYAIKMIGLRLDLILFDYKIFQTPYGMAVFCFSANLAFSIGVTRFLDARAFDRIIRAVCDKAWSDRGFFAYETYPQADSWLAPTYSLVEVLGKGGVRVSLATSVMTITGLLIMLIYLIPIATGVDFLWNFGKLADPGGKEFQYWSVFASVTASALFVIACISLTVKDFDQGD
jgi:hypothetical protein